MDTLRLWPIPMPFSPLPYPPCPSLHPQPSEDAPVLLASPLAPSGDLSVTPQPTASLGGPASTAFWWLGQAPRPHRRRPGVTSGSWGGAGLGSCWSGSLVSKGVLIIRRSWSPEDKAIKGT